tara:strand:- start:161 stop:358 length:198 start_codon:yes stop_codon:yes gene_type:complete
LSDIKYWIEPKIITIKAMKPNLIPKELSMSTKNAYKRPSRNQVKYILETNLLSLFNLTLIKTLKL